MADKHQGWILLYRSIREHWIWNRDDYTHAWIDLLLDVNHEERKVVISGKLTVIGRGQKWTSTRTLAARWGWSRDKVKHFLNLLQSDGMITLKKATNGTLLTLVNYDDFQIQPTTNRPQNDHKPDTDQATDRTKQRIKELNNKKNNKTRPIRSIQNFKPTDTDYDDLAYQIMNKPT